MRPVDRVAPLLCPLAVSLALFVAPALQAAPSPNHLTLCENGAAGGHACANVDLAAHLDLVALGASASTNGNDIWGWTDPVGGKEYALVGTGTGTSFVDVSTPDHPVVLGFLPTHSSESLWRDIKIHGTYAFIVSEAVDHGMQVFDLTRLRNVANPPQTFTSDAHYGNFGRAHNIVVNEDSDFAYAVGSRQGTTQCAGGLHMINIANPLTPQFAGCFDADGYTHDAQCVIYDGPDVSYQGRELCFNSNEDTLTIVDVTNKGAPVQVARVGYSGSQYSHQGWLTPDHRWFLMDDELDELNNGHNTRTYVWDLSDLDQPAQSFSYTAQVAATDHNLYVRDQYAFLANYKSGLRILDLSGIEQGQISEVGFFDTYTPNDNNGFDGAWSSFPYFASGTVIVSDISGGLFVLRPRLCQEPAAVAGLVGISAGDNTIDLSWDPSAEPGVEYEVYRELGGCSAGPGERVAQGLVNPGFTDSPVSGQVDWGYRVRAQVSGGQCSSAFSACTVVSTGGACTAPPLFAGLATATSPNSSRCQVDLGWAAAAPNCSALPASYEVHRSTDAEFLPSAQSLIATTGNQDFVDFNVGSGSTYHYLVRSIDESNGAADGNLVRRAVTALGETESGTWSNGAEEGEPILGSGGASLLHVAWHVVEDVAHSGLRSYSTGYADADCIALTTAPIDLGNAGSSSLSFFQRYGIEDGWDGGRVEISTDGTNWSPLTPNGGYPQQITNGGNACGWPVGTAVYAGTSLAWQQQTFNLAAFDGPVQMRWVFSTDTAVSEEGWWIDSVQIDPALIPGSCTTILDDVIFVDDFE